MTTTAPTRILVLLGVAAAALAGFLLVLRPIVLDDDESATAPAKPAQQTGPRSAGPAARPRVQLLQGLPTRIAGKLRHSKVVVVALYTPRAPADQRVVSQSRAGAAAAGVGFVALDVTNERRARELTGFADAIASPAVLVVRRPGRVVNRIEGATDSQIVAQAAQNARGPAKKR